ncbi:MAG: helix-turn-helix transcriptional regulator [Alphaproteobacteria bacterium]|nr:helix-turn-helix transcriptional regulator [Alphaproteobacteria bacterium]
MDDVEYIMSHLENFSLNPVDVHVCQRIKKRRLALKMSRKTFAQKLNLTVEEVKKYESGMKRVSASRLWDFSQILGMPTDYFYADMDDETKSLSPRFVYPDEDLFWKKIRLCQEPCDPMHRFETLQLVHSYYKLRNRKAAYYFLLMLRELNRDKKQANKRQTTDIW